MALLHRGEASVGNFDRSRSPLHRASTPRPSISPLSVASKANKGSPIATRDAIMAQAEAQKEMEQTTDTVDAEVGDEHPDDGSSSLSEPEEDEDDMEQPDETVLSIEDGEQLAAHQSVEVDSEAETERLEETPKKLRKHIDDVGKTPSKLSQAATVDEELSEPPSPLPLGPGAASSTSTIGTMGKKRKRSDTVESSLTSADSDLGEPPGKRSHESPPIADEEEEAVAETASEAPIEETPIQDEVRATSASVTSKGSKGKRGRQKGKKAKDVLEELDHQPNDQTAEVEEEASEDTSAKTEEQRQNKTEASSMFDEVAKKFYAFREKLLDERLASANAELELLERPPCQHPEYLRQVACVDARLEKQVREANAFYHYRLKSIRERTLGDRSQLHSQHFQALREQRERILYQLAEDWHDIQRERRQSHQQEKDEAGYLYKFPTKKSVQLRQQAKYNQEVSILSGIAKYVGWPAAPEITATTRDNLEDDFKAMKIPRRVYQPTTTTTTVAAAPPPKISGQQQPAYLPHPLPVTAQQTRTQSDRDAHQQFIEQNAWAQPQRPSIIHHHGSNGIGAPNLTHTPDWADSIGARNPLIRNGNSGGGRVSSPYGTPLPQKRSLGLNPDGGLSQRHHDTAHDDAVEPPSGTFTAPSTTGDRSHPNQYTHQYQNHNQTSSPPPLSVVKQRQHGSGNASEEVSGRQGGARNISNISHLSGASTIDATSSPPDPLDRDRRWMTEKGPLPLPVGSLRNNEAAHLSTTSYQPPTQEQHHHHALDPPTPLYHHSHPHQPQEHGDQDTSASPLPHSMRRRDIFSNSSAHSFNNDRQGVAASASASAAAGVGFRPLSLQNQQSLQDGGVGFRPSPSMGSGTSLTATTTAPTSTVSTSLENGVIR